MLSIVSGVWKICIWIENGFIWKGFVSLPGTVNTPRQINDTNYPHKDHWIGEKNESFETIYCYAEFTITFARLYLTHNYFNISIVWCNFVNRMNISTIKLLETICVKYFNSMNANGTSKMQVLYNLNEEWKISRLTNSWYVIKLFPLVQKRRILLLKVGSSIISVKTMMMLSSPIIHILSIYDKPSQMRSHWYQAGAMFT